MGWTGLKSEPWKVKNHILNASQHHFYCFLKEIWILKSGCSWESPTHAHCSHTKYLKRLIIIPQNLRLNLLSPLPFWAAQTLNTVSSYKLWNTTINTTQTRIHQSFKGMNESQEVMWPRCLALIVGRHGDLVSCLSASHALNEWLQHCCEGSGWNKKKFVFLGC